MQVILLTDEPTLGKRGAIVTVSDSFAFNNLIPRGIAKAATPQVIRHAQQQARKERADAAAARAATQEAADALHKKKITIHAQAKNGKLFGSVTAKDIVAAVAAQHNITIAEKSVRLDAPIKELTTREVKIDYGDGIVAGVIVTVRGT